MSVKLNDKQVKSLLRKGVVGRYAAGNGIYDRYDYLDERREALQKVADLLEPIIDPV